MNLCLYIFFAIADESVSVPRPINPIYGLSFDIGKEKINVVGNETLAVYEDVNTSCDIRKVQLNLNRHKNLSAYEALTNFSISFRI